MKTRDRTKLYQAISGAWSRSTSADPARWTESNPAWGQCAVTALLVQDALGGRLARTMIDGVSHYYNLLPTGEAVDLTRGQFPAGSVATDKTIRDRDYVLSFPETSRRYGVLKAAVRMFEADQRQPPRNHTGLSRRRRSISASPCPSGPSTPS
jgi:hypothetical protein